METPSVFIRDYTFDALSLSARESFDSERPIVCQVSVGFSVAGHPTISNAFKVDLHLTFDTEGLQDPPNLPYNTSLSVHGYFDTSVKIAPNAIPASLVLNALMILYGLARGYVGQVSASYPHGHFVIPSIVFDSAVKTAAENKDSNVVLDVKSVGPSEPGVPEFFRFLFAIEDLPRYANLISDEPNRDESIQQIANVIELVNNLPQATDTGAALNECLEAVYAVRQTVARVSSPLGSVLAAQLSWIEDGIRRVSVKTQAEVSTEVTE